MGGKPRQRITTLAEAWDELGKAMARLDPDHKRVGRKNSRDRMIYCLKRMRTILDQQYPPVPKETARKQRVKSLKRRSREFDAKMKRMSYIAIPYDMEAPTLIEAGIKLHVNPATNTYWVPIWAAHFWQQHATKVKHSASGRSPWPAASTLKKVSRDRKRCRVLEAEWRLHLGNPEPVF